MYSDIDLANVLGIVLLYALFVAGLFVIIASFIRFSNTPKENEVLERWSAFLTGQVESDEEFLSLIETELDARDCPYDFNAISLGISGDRAIRVNFSYKFNAFISCETIGKDLQITWILHEKPSWLYGIPFIGPALYRIWNIVTVVDRNQLLAFGAFTKSCTENVVDSIMDEHDLDKTRLVRQSSGKLGPL